jgi:hypothetical protein
MEMKTIIIISTMAAIIVGVKIWGGNIPNPYRSRGCMGRKWKQEFPHVSKEEIGKFLHIFTEAFAFNPGKKLKFGPQDEIIEIYSALYPFKGADALEVETLAEEIENVYSVDFDQIWKENLTLGELFDFVICAQQGASPDGNYAALHCRR